MHWTLPMKVTHFSSTDDYWWKTCCSFHASCLTPLHNELFQGLIFYMTHKFYRQSKELYIKFTTTKKMNKTQNTEKIYKKVNHMRTKSAETVSQNILTCALRPPNVSTLNLSSVNRFCSITKSQLVPSLGAMLTKKWLLMMTAKPRGLLFIVYAVCKINQKTSKKYNHMHTHIHTCTYTQ